MLVVVLRILFFAVLGITIAGGVSSSGGPRLFNYFDLVLHFGAFGALGGLLVLSFARQRWMPGAIGLVVLGGVIELVQGTFLPGRHASALDFVADTSGVLLGVVIAQHWFREQLKRWLGHLYSPGD